MEEKGKTTSALARTKRPDYYKGLETGKLPPQALDLEEAVLGALMLDKNAMNDVMDTLKVSSFYKDAHQKVYQAILNLFSETQPVDILTVTQELRKMGELEAVGGAYFISQLTNRVASTANIEYHARIIAQKHIQRELIRISSTLITKAYDETSDVFELLDEAEKNLFDISEGNIKKNYDSMKDILSQAIKQIEESKNKEDGLSGVGTGFHALDRVTSGWQPSDLIILAARPGMGKTAFVLSMARNMAVDFNTPVAIFSLEMSNVQLVNRLISAETGISAEKIRKGSLDDSEYVQLHSRIDKLAEAPIFIDDTAALGVFELRAKCRRLVMQHHVKIIIIDYLQLMSGSSDKGGNRVQEITEISRSLKIIAKELNVPVIALSQLSRSVETRGGDKKPMLSDLRESGSIEQDADIVTFILRREYYKIHEDENGEPTDGTGDIIIAKHRNGSLEDVRLRFVPHLAKFDNLESFGGADFQNAPMNPSDAFAQNPGLGMSASNSFDASPEPSSNTIIKGSKMNDLRDDEDDDFLKGGPDEAPF